MNDKMKCFFCGFLMVLAAFQLQAQSLLNHIPQDAMMIMSVHPDALNKKMSVDKIKSLQLYEMMLQEMSRSMNPEKQQEIYDIFKNPSNYGIDLFSGSYLFGDVETGLEKWNMNYIFRLNDKTKFRSLLNEYAGEEFLSGITQESGYELSVNEMGGMALAWTDNMVAFYIEQGGIDAEYLEEEDDGEEVDETGEMTKTAKANFEKLFKMTPAQSISSLTGYTSVATGDKDVMVWVNYEDVMSIYTNFFDQGTSVFEDLPGGTYAKMFSQAFRQMYDDSYLGVKLNFNQGAVVMDYDMYMGANMARYFSGMTDNRIDKKFARYIKGDNLLGYFAFSVNIPKMVEGYREMGLDMVKDMPMVGDLSRDVLDIIGIAIDEEALYNLFTGDMLFAVTGMREFEKMMKTYEYDDDFNEIEVEKMVKESLPEFTLMMSYGNQADLMKFMRLGLHTSVIQQEGNYFKASIPDLPMDLYMAMKDGIFFVSNNTDLIRNRLSKKGYSKKERLSKAHCKKLMKHPMVLYWDVPTTMQAAAELSPQAAGMLNAERSPVREVTMTWDPITGRQNRSRLTVGMADNNRNSFEVLMELMEQSLPMLMQLGM